MAMNRTIRLFSVISRTLVGGRCSRCILQPQPTGQIYIFFVIQRVKARVIPCPHQPPTRGDNTVSVAQGGTATPGTTKHLLPPDWVLREYIHTHTHIYIYIYIRTPDQLWAETTLDVNLHKKRVYFRPLMLLRVYSNRFLCNHTGMVVPCAFHSCWKLLAFDQIELDAYCTAVWRRFEATFKLWPVIPIFERNEMTECPTKPRQPTSIGITWHIQPFSTHTYGWMYMCIYINITKILRQTD